MTPSAYTPDDSVFGSAMHPIKPIRVSAFAPSWRSGMNGDMLFAAFQPFAVSASR
jgi:hypothetical protein